MYMQHDVINSYENTKCCKMGWTEEKVNKLKDLWGKGQTASQIAEIIGGVSRNAVIGKAHRLNLSSKIKARKPNQNQKKVQNYSEKQIQLKGRRGKFKSLLLLIMIFLK